MTLLNWKAGLFAAAALGTVSLAGVGSAQTLSQTLINALNSSPTLEINRAALRSLTEGVVQARSGKRPQVSATATAGLTKTEGVDDISESYRAALNASLLLYDGGRTDAAVNSARAQVKAAEAQFDNVVQSVLLTAITAFVDVRRDVRFVSLAQNNVRVIGQQVTAAQDRFDVGEVTRTDVSQAQARLASARSNLSTNRGGLERSRQAYLAAVGSPVNKLSAPPRLPELPKSLEQALMIAVREHPNLKAAQANIEGAEYDLMRAQAGRRPTLSLNGSIDYTDNSQGDGTSANLSLTGNLPLYQGGEIDSLMRQAQSLVDRRKAELQNTARTVKQDVALAWSNLNVARSSIVASRQEIRAAKLAFEGVREEAKLGARTTLDTLDAEQDVLNAESGLVSAQRDQYVAAYNLIFSMGLLSPEYLNLGIDLDRITRAYDAPIEGSVLTRRAKVVEGIRNRWDN